MNIEAIDPASFEAAIPGLGALLKDAVDGGASVNFVSGVTREQTEGWWTARTARVADGTITVFVARDDGGRIVVSGPPASIAKSKQSRTAPYLAQFLCP